jgi:hypothetical protein
VGCNVSCTAELESRPVNDRFNCAVVTVEFGEIVAVHANVVDPAAVTGAAKEKAYRAASKAMKDAPPERRVRRLLVVLFVVIVAPFLLKWTWRYDMKIDRFQS